jgi:hypothetical protein
MYQELAKLPRLKHDAPIVDDVLAEMLRNVPNPVEDIVLDQGKAIFLTMLHKLSGSNPSYRLVELTCGHYTKTRLKKSAPCQRCGEMIRAGYDYEAFKNRGALNRFVWPGDPLRMIHEPGFWR